MLRRGIVLLVAAALLTAGCLDAGGDPVSNASSDDPVGNETDRSDDGTASEGDESRSDGSNDQSDGNDTTSGSREDDNRETDGSDEDQANRPPPWPDAAEASIRPGVQVVGSGQCTSNFLFRTPDNGTLMLGVAAHCFDQGNSTTGSNGCAEGVNPIEPGAEVEIENASQPGELVYSSFWTMQQMDDPSAAACRDNDFALVAISAGDRPDVHPAVEAIGGPTGLVAGGGIASGDEVRWFGNTGLTPSSPATNRHEGRVVSSTDWSFEAYSATPGLPGDSGSGVMLGDGSAAGVLVTVNAFYPGANGVTKLEPALAFAGEHADLEVELVTWQTFEDGPAA